MKVSHQIRSRREAANMSVSALAQRIGVTEQAVRHWESGRSYPGKATARAIEEALEFRIDWTEGAHTGGEAASATAMINPRDLDLLLLICRLPADFKAVVESLAGMHLKAIEGSRFVERDTTSPVGSFRERENVENAPKGRRIESRSAAGRGSRKP